MKIHKLPQGFAVDYIGGNKYYDRKEVDTMCTELDIPEQDLVDALESLGSNGHDTAYFSDITFRGIGSNHRFMYTASNNEKETA